MSASEKPRKPYRPRAAGRPVLQRMRDQLILPSYVALETLRSVNDDHALESARHSLAACLNYMSVACQLAGRPQPHLDVIEDGKRALLALIERHQARGVWRCTGPELQALRAAIVACDGQLPYLRTDQLQAAILNVDQALFGGNVPAHLRINNRVEVEVAQ